ncbi:hypothetical protein [Rubellicoccus peritrichatus]|uniref:Uncharacterized protein n=1 Tax=Rubellicoccus peritrichatus TaxID=3080537 RepID=A0AAQ3L896_9BACT|nr:hypothetical protein [Puniceicoccus sp. CR14]WOO41489.1 hypothetical protein RZN69_00210 [Puniceicoccus sp. CR14]
MPNNETNLVDLGFLDARCKLIDIAAFMDRIERSGQTDDYRYQALLKALTALQSKNRAEAVLNSLSDPTSKPVEEATAGPAAGAWKG